MSDNIDIGDDIVSAYLKENEERTKRIKERSEANKKSILECLKRLEATRVTVDYSGSGDSGQVDSVMIFKGDTLIKNDAKITIIDEKSHFDNVTKKWIYEQTTCEVGIEEALENFAMDAVWVRHAGWENNDGASGTLEVGVSEESFKLGHVEYYTESNSFDYEL